MFVLLFLAGGGAIEGEVMLGSSLFAAAAVTPDGPDIDGVVASCTDARLLFRAPVGERASGLVEPSAVVGRG